MLPFIVENNRVLDRLLLLDAASVGFHDCVPPLRISITNLVTIVIHCQIQLPVAHRHSFLADRERPARQIIENGRRLPGKEVQARLQREL